MTGHGSWFRRYAGPRTAALMDQRGRAAAAAVWGDSPRSSAPCNCDAHGQCPNHRWTNTNPQ